MDDGTERLMMRCGILMGIVDSDEVKEAMRLCSVCCRSVVVLSSFDLFLE
jgi:hypothetical protein